MIRLATRIVLFAGLAACLAACNQSQPDRQFSTDADSAVTAQFVAGQTLSAPITGRNNAPDFAVLTLPAAAGAPGKLAEKQFVNGWRQSTSLGKTKVAGDWNDLSIDIQSQEPTDAYSEQMRISKPTQESVRREILARFHNVPMRIVTRPMHNALGPFGLAVGAGPSNMRCVFAWQWISNLPAAARGEKANFFNTGDDAASIRMRLCRKGVTADELAAWYEGLRITDPANVARIVEALRRSEDAPVVAGGVQVVDNSNSLEATLIGGGQAERASGGGDRPRRRHAHHRRRAPAEEAPETIAPLTTPSSPSADGRRYLGPVESVSPPYAPSPPSGGAGFGPARVNGGLPAQAYRGPSGSRATTPPSGGAPVYLGPTQ